MRLPLVAIVASTALFAVPAAAQTSTALARYDFSTRSGRIDLPGPLDEISGLAFTPDGRLFGHADERAWVHELDPEAGSAKRYMFGDRTARDDFEGIAIVGERVFLVSSRGLLYESREGEHRQEMPYRVTDLGLAHVCEVEGLDFRPPTGELLVACKTVRPDRGAIVIHRIPIDPDLDRPAPIRVMRAGLAEWGLGDSFHPSGVAFDPATEHLLLVSAREEALIEIDADGRIVAAIELRKRRHRQTEGIALGPDGVLYLADEKNGSDARLTWYAPSSGGIR